MRAAYLLWGHKGLKNSLKRQSINHSVSYLIDAGYINKKTSNYTTKNNQKKETNPKYKISSLGIKMFENPGIFEPNNKYISGLNIGNVESLVIVGNKSPIIINQKFEDIGNALENLRDKIDSIDSVTNSIKLNLYSLINSLESMYISDSPIKSISDSILNSLKEKLAELAVSNSIDTVLEYFNQNVLPMLENIIT